MWKTALSKSIRELRFVVKQAPEHHGVWKFVETRLPELIMLNQGTFFTVTEISDEFQCNSAVHVVYGDASAREDEILTSGLSREGLEKTLQEKIAIGCALPRGVPKLNNDCRELPCDIVEARNTVAYLDDGY